jgi:hypothetical protein
LRNAAPFGRVPAGVEAGRKGRLIHG